MDDLKKIGIALLIGLLLGAGLEKVLAPAKVETKYQEVVKEVIKEVKVENKDVKTVIEKTTNKDGTVTEKTTIEDKSTETVQTNKSKDTMVKIETKSDNRPDWRVGAQAGMKNMKGDFIYGATVERRILGPLFVGLNVNGLNTSEKIYNIGASWEF